MSATDGLPLGHWVKWDDARPPHLEPWQRLRAVMAVVLEPDAGSLLDALGLNDLDQIGDDRAQVPQWRTAHRLEGDAA